jgi:fido (protein-threonine AMPylation protein)
MMFLVSEVHPFADGNGRIARVMMNAELVAEGETRIVVPTIYRNNYMIALKALSQNGITGALVRAMDFAHRYTAAVDFSELSQARVVLGQTRAFMDSNEADAASIRLKVPEPGPVRV